MKTRKKFFHLLIIVIISYGILLAQSDNSVNHKNWQNWRGPLNTGEALEGNPPIIWNETKNVRWKTPIPGKGLSTPVVWGNYIFITSAIEINKVAEQEKIKTQQESRATWMRMSGVAKNTDNYQQFNVYTISRKDGKILWQKTMREAYPHEGTHVDGSWASNSCVTDGNYVYAYFGSYGLYCLKFNGDLVWEKDLGDMKVDNAFGEGSSPCLYKDYLIINWDHEGDSFLYLLNKKTGEIIWQKARDERTTWSTPIVAEIDGKLQIIISATGKSRGYDLSNGDVIWELGGLTDNVIPSPVYTDGILYLMSGFRGSMLQAIDLSKATGDLQNSDAVIWTTDKNTSYVPSALLYKNTIYFLKTNRESLTSMNAKTGEIYYTKQDLDGMKGVYASPVACKDRVYIAGRNGVVYVIKQGKKFEVLAKNSLDDGFDASPAIAGNDLILRGLKNLYCISEK